MASNPVPSNFLPIFEGYWKQCDPQNSGKVMAADAAALLKTSQLKQSTLHRIWLLADSSARGYLDKQGFFTALRLVAVCQNGKEPSLSNLSPSDPLPQLSTTPSPAAASVLGTAKPWVIDADDRKQFVTMFNGLQPSNGKLSGAKARETFLKSGLPKDMLSKIWTLADADGDGALTINEFAIAMYIIQRCRGGEPVPPSLPPSLKVSTSPVSSPSHGSKKEPFILPVPTKWAITPEMKTKYDAYFTGIDKDKDGFVTGEESRGLFMASSLPQNVLANIWNLVDFKSTGKLNAEQFAVAMHLISEKVRGNELPDTLPPQLIPPSMRSTELDSTASKDASSSLLPFSSSSSLSLTAVGSVGGDMGGGGQEMSFSSDFSAIRELDGLNTELESLTKEKERLQQEVKVQENEMISAKDDVQALKNTLQESQAKCQELGAEMSEAQAKLDQLSAEKTSMEQQLFEARRSVEETKIAVELLKEELQGKKEALKSQSEELQKLQVELQALKKEEAAMRLEVESDRAELQRVQQTVMDTKNQINRVQETVNTLKDDQRTVNASLSMYSSIGVGGGISTSGAGAKGSFEGGLGDLLEDQSQLRREADSVSARATAGSNSPMSSLSGLSEFVEENKEDNASKVQMDPFSSASGEDPFSSIGGFSDDPFKTPTATTFGGSGGFSDPFAGIGGDPFKESSSMFGQQFQPGPSLLSGDPFTPGDNTDDPFKSTPKQAVVGADPFKSTAPDGGDPFAFSGDAFGGTSGPVAGGDPFGIPPSSGGMASNDPFGGGGSSHDDSRTPPSNDPFADPFGSDSFGSAGWTGDSTTATASTGLASSTPKGTKTVKKSRSSEKEQLSWAYTESQKTLKRQQQKEDELRKKEEEDLARAIKESLKTAKK